MPSEVRYPEVRKLLELHGWTCSRIKGSHHIFTKEGELPIRLRLKTYSTASFK